VKEFRVILFGLLLLFITSSPVWGDTLPKSIGSLQLERIQSGEEARKEIDRLHGKKLKFREGYIGTYGNENIKAKVWVSEYEFEAEAQKEIGQMAQRIKAKGGKVFRHFRLISVEGVKVYFTVGMGQVHYFFQKGVKAIWLAVDPSEAKEAVRDFIGKFR